MRTSLRLYCKELRFLAGPGIVLVVLNLVASWLFLLLLSKTPSPYASSPVGQYIIRPMNLLFSIETLRIVYGLLFFYALIHEHVTKTRYQLFMLPTRRWQHILCKLAAIMTWVAVYVVTTGLMWRLLVALQPHRPGEALASFQLMLSRTGPLLSETAGLVSIMTAGYVEGLMFRRMKYLISTITMIAGYMLAAHLRTFFYQYFARNYGMLPYGWLRPWFDVVFPVVPALMFVVPALFLYEKYSEV